MFAAILILFCLHVKTVDIYTRQHIVGCEISCSRVGGKKVIIVMLQIRHTHVNIYFMDSALVSMSRVLVEY